METVISILIGIGLSAACGFRIFVPLLVMSVAAMSGHLTLGQNFQWIGTYPALIAFAVATGLEIGGYYIPWLDNLLDSIATPAAIIAGTIVTASVVTGTSPLLKWTLAIIAGGGIAGLIQGTTVVARGASSVGTGGLGNPLLATVEFGGSLLASLLAVIAPLLGVTLLAVFLIFAGRKLLARPGKAPQA
jgi:Domain of unknown function (DUF4126)